MAKVLLVEDETDILSLMELHLIREGHQVRAVMRGEEALGLLNRERFDLAVVDWMLPGLSGLDLCREIRARDFAKAILMVTARAEGADVVAGLDAGADDYMTKPFDLTVFMARVRALTRGRVEVGGPKSDGSLVMGGIRLDPTAHRVFCEGAELDLTPSEFKLLAALMAHSGKVLSRERLIDLVQGEGVVVVDRAIDTHVFGLRKKLGACASSIETVRGVGYRLA